MWHAGRMAQDVCPIVFGEDRARLEAIVADRNRAQKHVLRARIVLHSADRLSVAEVARRAGVGRPAVWRWQRRFALAGVDAVTMGQGYASLSPAMKETERLILAGQIAHDGSPIMQWNLGNVAVV